MPLQSLYIHTDLDFANTSTATQGALHNTNIQHHIIMKTSSLLAAVAIVISSIVSVSARPEEAFFSGDPCIGAMDEFCPAGYNADAELPASVAQ